MQALRMVFLELDRDLFVELEDSFLRIMGFRLPIIILSCVLIASLK